MYREGSQGRRDLLSSRRAPDCFCPFLNGTVHNIIQWLDLKGDLAQCFLVFLMNIQKDVGVLRHVRTLALARTWQHGLAAQCGDCCVTPSELGLVLLG